MAQTTTAGSRLLFQILQFTYPDQIRQLVNVSFCDVDGAAQKPKEYEKWIQLESRFHWALVRRKETPQALKDTGLKGPHRKWRPRRMHAGSSASSPGFAWAAMAPGAKGADGCAESPVFP